MSQSAVKKAVISLITSRYPSEYDAEPKSLLGSVCCQRGTTLEQRDLKK